MFKLKRPCSNCPFRKGQGELFQLNIDRLAGMLTGDAFQCHKTIDYDHFEDPKLRQGEHPQQCAGIMSVLWREKQPNKIMQVAIAFGYLDPNQLDPENEAYSSIQEVLRAHGHYIKNFIV